MWSSNKNTSDSTPHDAPFGQGISIRAGLTKALLVSSLSMAALTVCQSLGSLANISPIPVTADTPTKQNLSLDLSGRHEYQLDNGLKIIIKEDHRAPVVMTQIWYKVGSSDEPADKGGISHLLEHMMFKGTKRISANDFERLVAKYGGVNNAFTSYDYTVSGQSAKLSA